MPSATERDDDRWQVSLDLAKETSQAMIELRKMVQRGFEDIARAQIETRGRVAAVESEVKALRLTEADCQQRLTRLEAEGTARGVVLKWLLTFGMINAVGAIVVAILLLSMLSRLFSLAG